MNFCKFCNKEGKYQTSTGQWLCEPTSNSCPVVRKKNSESLKNAHCSGKMRKFTESDRKKSNLSLNKKFADLPFVNQSYKRRREIVIKEQNGCCLICQLSLWLGKPIQLQIDHINGNNKDNARSNLRALCLNCHSLTETFCGKNINNGQKLVSDIDILK